MGLALVTEPTAEVVSLALAKLHVRQDLDADDTLIAAMLEAAVTHIEAKTNRKLRPETWRLTLPVFPATGLIRLPYPPLQEVKAITYRDGNGDTQTLDESAYVVTTSTLPGQVTRADGATWPTTQTHPEAVTIEFVCGYPAPLPKPLTAAILLTLGDLYVNREARFVGTIQTDNPAVAALVGPYTYLEAV